MGDLTGFPPGTIVGNIHVADPASVVAAIDMDKAYNALFATTCDVVLGTTLGNSQVLSPNVYCLGGAAFLTGDLILDGQGDPGNKNQAVTIYPNPFKTSINVNINDSPLINSVEFQMYNVLGVEVINRTLTKKSNTLETRNLPAGIYLYKVIVNGDAVQSGKLISQQ